jgi:hypothetical protein
MPVKLEIPNEQVERFKELYKVQIGSTKSSIEKLQQELSFFESALRQLENGTQEAVNPPPENDDGIIVNANGYIPKWSYPRKIRFIFETKKKWFTSRQIQEIIMSELEAETWRDKSKKEKDALYATISSTLTNNSKEGKDFQKKQNEIEENIYFLVDKK